MRMRLRQCFSVSQQISNCLTKFLERGSLPLNTPQPDVIAPKATPSTFSPANSIFHLSRRNLVGHNLLFFFWAVFKSLKVFPHGRPSPPSPDSLQLLMLLMHQTRRPFDLLILHLGVFSRLRVTALNLTKCSPKECPVPRWILFSLWFRFATTPVAPPRALFESFSGMVTTPSAVDLPLFPK